MSNDQRLDLPPPSSPNFDEKVREAISTYLGKRGDKLDRGVTLRDLVEARIISLSDTYLKYGGTPVAGVGTSVTAGAVGPPGPTGPAGPAGTPYTPDLTAPPMPSGTVVSAGLSFIYLETAVPSFTQGHGYARTRVYATKNFVGTPIFLDALLVHEFIGPFSAFPSDPNTTWNIWMKWVTVDGMESTAPSGLPNGQVASTTLIDTPHMANLAITNAKIANGTIDNAKIANLSVNKLTGSDLQVGSFIQSSNYISGTSGFKIKANGEAEFTQAIVYGAIYANTGTFAGNISAASGTFNGGVRGGAFTGYAWPAAGAGSGYYLGPGGGGAGVGGLLLGSYNEYLANPTGGVGYFGIDAATGNVYSPNFNISGGVLTFNGSGTFSGALSAASGTFAGSLSAATGTFSGTLTASAVNAVNTINIAGESVTAGRFVTTTTQVSVARSGAGYSTHITTGSVFIPSISGRTSSVSVEVDLVADPGQGRYPDVRVSLWRGSYLVYEQVMAFNQGTTFDTNGTPSTFAVPTANQMVTVEFPPPGTHIYYLKASSDSTTGNTNVFPSLANIKFRLLSLK